MKDTQENRAFVLAETAEKLATAVFERLEHASLEPDLADMDDRALYAASTRDLAVASIALSLRQIATEVANLAAWLKT